MQASVPQALIIIVMSVCSGSSSESSPNTPYEYSCEDYEIMWDVEIELARECISASDCQQILFEGDLTCESNSVLGDASFSSEYLYSLYDEALEAGCSLDIPFNQDCSLTEPACVNSSCVWQ